MNKNKGFTLIEIMIAVAIIAIIASIAIPSYSDYIRDANRNEAMQELLTYASELERTKVLAGEYVSSADSDYVAVPSTTIDANENFNFFHKRAGTSFSIVAVAKGSQTADSDCLALYTDNLGQKKSYSTGTIASFASANETSGCWQ